MDAKTQPRIEPFPDAIDYFSVFGLGRKMQIDLEDLEKRFHDLSRKFHPDRHQTKSSAEREISQSNSAVVNKAYRTLRDPISRAEYLVGLIDGNQQIAVEAPAELLEEILDLQETLEEFRRLPDRNEPEKESLREKLLKIRSDLRMKDRDLSAQMERAFVRWDGASPDDRETQRRVVGEMKEILSHRSYLGRVLVNLQQALGENG
jgi:molecular chaperone HscB